MHKHKTRVFIAGEEQTARASREGGGGKHAPRSSLLAATLRVCRGRTVAIFGTLATCGVVGVIVINALWMQSGPHPAPLLARKPAAEVQKSPGETTGTLAGSARARAADPAPAPTGEAVPPSPRPRPQSIEDLQRELAGSERKAAPPNPAATTPRPPRKIEPGGNTSPTRVTAVQRALAEYGYGQIRVSGVVDEPTRKAVERFERERNLPVTGQFSPRLLRELAAVTGRPIN